MGGSVETSTMGVSEDSNVHEELEKLSSPAGFQPEDFVHAHGI